MEKSGTGTGLGRVGGLLAKVGSRLGARGRRFLVLKERGLTTAHQLLLDAAQALLDVKFPGRLSDRERAQMIERLRRTCAYCMDLSLPQDHREEVIEAIMNALYPFAIKWPKDIIDFIRLQEGDEMLREFATSRDDIDLRICNCEQCGKDHGSFNIMTAEAWAEFDEANAQLQPRDLTEDDANMRNELEQMLRMPGLQLSDSEIQSLISSFFDGPFGSFGGLDMGFGGMGSRMPMLDLQVIGKRCPGGEPQIELYDKTGKPVEGMPEWVRRQVIEAVAARMG